MTRVSEDCETANNPAAVETSCSAGDATADDAPQGEAPSEVAALSEVMALLDAAADAAERFALDLPVLAAKLGTIAALVRGLGQGVMAAP